MTPPLPVDPPLVRIFGRWGAPPDAVAWAALGAAALCVAYALAPRSRARALFDPTSPESPEGPVFVTVLAFVAAFLSLGYVACYLRGGPRIIDATTYFLQARALAEGKLAWALPSPTASFRGRFLFTADGATVAPIFPPGYPLLLALGFRVGAPLVVGPALAFALVVATFFLGREVAASALGAKVEDPRVVATARLAAALSVVCAALRYHTADTMAHGAAALGVTAAVASALALARAGPLPGSVHATRWCLTGLAVGYVAATRMVSAVPVFLVTALLALRAPRPRAAALALAVGILPGLGLLCAAQAAATGHALRSTQLAYYAASDGPPGCFRYGFGRGIGCLLEHGDVVERDLQGGYGLLPAVTTLFRRARLNLEDVANLRLLALLLLVPLGAARRGARGVRALYLLVGSHALAYTPFYFDGSYPGGGARMFADVLPAEHVLLALGALLAGDNGRAGALAAARFAPRALAVLALALAGFAVHTAFEHRALADRDGGRPYFEPDALAHGDVKEGLVFVDTDHGFALGFDPAARAATGVVVARLRGDDRDRLLYDDLGRPPAYVYRRTDDGPLVVPWAAKETLSSRGGWSFEAEAEWPPLRQKDGWLDPAWVTTSCASAGRAAVLLGAGGTEPEAWIELPVPFDGPWLVVPHIYEPRAEGDPLGAHGTLELRAHLDETAGPPLAAWEWTDTDPSLPTCRPLEVAPLNLPPRRVFLRLRADMGRGPHPIALDRIELRSPSGR